MNFELTHQRQVAGPLCFKQRKHEIDEERRNFWNEVEKMKLIFNMINSWFSAGKKKWRKKGIQSWFGNEICDKISKTGNEFIPVVERKLT